MPRIRKKTSNRASTNDRAKVRHKVRETKRKKVKAAKKNPQWKSRQPKDPGIPNEFPYKDQILAEIVEEQRRAAEEKDQRKAEKQKARAIASGKIVEDDTEEDGEGAEGRDEKEEDKEGERTGHEKDMEEEVEEEVPVLINRDLPTLQSVLDKADVVLEVVDARDPMVFRSEHVEQLVKDAGKKVLLVLNKIDTCPREALTAWTGYLRKQRPTFTFRSATAFLPEGPSMQDPLLKKTNDKGKAKVSSDNALGAESLLSCLSQWAKEKEGDETLIVAVVGMANVGKSSLINSLLKRAALPIYSLASSSKGPSTTEVPQEVALEFHSQKIMLIDTPGLSFVSDEDVDQSTLEEFRARDILLRNKGRIDRLKDPHPPVVHIVSRANAEDLMVLYSLPAFTKGDCNAFLSGVARANQLVKKKGELDLNGAARIVLRDWSLGKITRYTIPSDPAVTAAQSSSEAKLIDTVTQLYANDEAILSIIQTRKEKRKQGGLVRFTCGSIDSRKVAVGELWNGSEQNSDGEGSDDEVDDEIEVESMNANREDEEDKDEEEEVSDPDMEDSQETGEDSENENVDEDDDESEIELPRPSRNQKRKRGSDKSTSLPLAKKVAFAAMPPKLDRSKIEAAMKSKKESTKAVQQEKKSLKPRAVQASNAMKRLSKPGSAATATPVHKSSDKKGKIANVTVKTKPKGHLALAGKSRDKSEPELYDFGKFF